MTRCASRQLCNADRKIAPQGLTGTLSMDAQGRVRRELEWVRIKGGAPTPLEAISTSAATP